jgi:hypothetical protein
MVAIAGTLTLPAAAGTPASATYDRSFDPATATATLRVWPHELDNPDPLRIRPADLAVYVDGRRQPNVSVRAEHVPVDVTVLVEMGGRSREWNRTLGIDGVSLARHVLDRLDARDRLTLLTYDAAVHDIITPATPRDDWTTALRRMEAPVFSEANLYDAVSAALDRAAAGSGRRALVLVTSGVDTFSHIPFDDLLVKARRDDIPIFVVSLSATARLASDEAGPMARVRWPVVDERMRRLAARSGGRAYFGLAGVGSAGVFDDIFERLRLRFVLTYAASADSAERPVQVRVEPRRATVKGN